MAALRMVVPLVVLMSAVASAQSQVVTITEPVWVPEILSHCFRKF